LRVVFVAASLGIKKKDVYCRMVLDIVKTDPNGPVPTVMRKAIEGTPESAAAATPVIVSDSSAGAAQARKKK
jgi:hypothetical protein